MNLREWALPVYTILMQLAVGSMATLWIMRTFFRSKFGDDQLEALLRNPVAIIMVTIAAAMVGSFFHLSRPYISFLAILNLGASWLSREIVFTVLLFLCVAALWYLQAYVDQHWGIKSALGWAAILFGVMAAFCMTQLYKLPTQAAWDTSFTFLSFFSSMILLGVSASLTILTLDLQFIRLQHSTKVDPQAEIIRHSLPAFAIVVVVVFMLVIVQYYFLIQHLSQGDVTAQASLQLYLGLYQPLLIFRLLAGLSGVSVMVFAMLWVRWGKLSVLNLGKQAYIACLLILVGEILGRFLFYATHIRTGI